jgi:cyanophycinase-like exopeptidase
MLKSIQLVAFSLFTVLLFGQSYTSFFTGNREDAVTNPMGGVCLMGGSTESDSAMIWFLNRASGGDILVIRASGSNGYNNYMFTTLGVKVNSVESIVFNNRSASFDPYVIDRIKKAEAIWMAGGDQWNYVRYWRNSPVDSLINKLILKKNIVIGGTSAGMAVLGQYYFSAENNTVTTAEALANPFDTKVTVDSTSFFKVPSLKHVITDSHYDERNRRGRHTVFMSRILKDYNDTNVLGIACNESAAVCIESNGKARVFGTFPNKNTKAYFIMPNCENGDMTPEQFATNKPLIWDKNGKALAVYSVNGTPSGTHFFQLNDRRKSTGGNWNYWSVNNGAVSEIGGTEPNCLLSSHGLEEVAENIVVYPNPSGDTLYLENISSSVSSLEIINSHGQSVLHKNLKKVQFQNYIEIRDLPSGNYSLSILLGDGKKVIKKFVKG